MEYIKAFKDEYYNQDLTKVILAIILHCDGVGGWMCLSEGEGVNNEWPYDVFTKKGLKYVCEKFCTHTLDMNELVEECRKCESFFKEQYRLMCEDFVLEVIIEKRLFVDIFEDSNSGFSLSLFNDKLNDFKKRKEKQS